MKSLLTGIGAVALIPCIIFSPLFFLAYENDNKRIVQNTQYTTNIVGPHGEYSSCLDVSTYVHYVKFKLEDGTEVTVSAPYTVTKRKK